MKPFPNPLFLQTQLPLYPHRSSCHKQYTVRASIINTALINIPIFLLYYFRYILSVCLKYIFNFFFNMNLKTFACLHKLFNLFSRTCNEDGIVKLCGHLETTNLETPLLHSSISFSRCLPTVLLIQHLL